VVQCDCGMVWGLGAVFMMEIGVRRPRSEVRVL
jgi:hypothetical protein